MNSRLTLDGIFGRGMVLQRERQVRLWGKVLREQLSTPHWMESPAVCGPTLHGHPAASTVFLRPYYYILKAKTKVSGWRMSASVMCFC